MEERMLRLATCVVLASLVGAAPAAAQDAAKGEAVFAAQKCGWCHSVVDALVAYLTSIGKK